MVFGSFCITALRVIPTKVGIQTFVQARAVVAAKGGWIPARAVLGRNDGTRSFRYYGHSRDREMTQFHCYSVWVIW
jgi:hypothetical protein